MKITIEFDDAKELESLLAERDKRIARLAALEAEPLKFSLSGLAHRVLDDFPGLTPDQRARLRDKINEG